MNFTALLAGLLSGIAGAMGLGGGTFLIVYLTLFKDVPQLKSQGINLIFFIPCAILSIIAYTKARLIDWKMVLKVSLFGILGCVLGLITTHFIKGEIIGKIFGILLILLSLKEFFKRKPKNVAENKK